DGVQPDNRALEIRPLEIRIAGGPKHWDQTPTLPRAPDFDGGQTHELCQNPANWSTPLLCEVAIHRSHVLGDLVFLLTGQHQQPPSHVSEREAIWKAFQVVLDLDLLYPIHAVIAHSA